MIGKITIVACAVAGAIYADSLGVFGVREVLESDVRHVRFAFRDMANHAPVTDVHVACTRRMVRSACTEKRGPRPGETTITLAALRRTAKTWLFSKPLGYAVGGDGVVYLTFVHPNFERKVVELRDDGPYSVSIDRHIVDLTAAKPTIE